MASVSASLAALCSEEPKLLSDVEDQVDVREARSLHQVSDKRIVFMSPTKVKVRDRTASK